MCRNAPIGNMADSPFSAFCDPYHLHFKDEELLIAALTHRSYTNEAQPTLEHNGRLEFLGDAILSVIVADLLYVKFPKMQEGELTRLRSELVRGETLAELARHCNLGTHLRLGSGEENSGGRQKTSILAAAFEAIVGAIYLDQGIQNARGFCEPLFLQRLPEALDLAQKKDARSRLQEWAQAEHGITPRYVAGSQSGPANESVHIVEVHIKEGIHATGSGSSKQAAAQQAALNLLDQLAVDETPSGCP